MAERLRSIAKRTVKQRRKIYALLTDIYTIVTDPDAVPPKRPTAPVDLGTAETNIDFNRGRWGHAGAWLGEDQYGYRWGRGKQQHNSGPARDAQKFLHPYIDDRLDLKILELAPGAGRFTVELIRLSGEMHLVDLNQACIDICEDRFKFYPKVSFSVGDGMTVNCVEDEDFDLVACYDSMVHMTADVIDSYVGSFWPRLKPGGLCWLDHSGKGFKEAGHRTDMTHGMMRDFAHKHGFEVVTQQFRNDHDCISVLRKASKPQ